MAVDVNAVVAEVGRAIDENLPELTAQMTEFFIEVIPEFRHDETVRKLMIASTSSNLVAIVDMLAHTIALDGMPVPPAAAEYARRFAQHDLSLEALLRAYRLGEQRFTQWAIDVLSGMRHIGTTDALAALGELTLRTNRYIDQVIEGLIDIYETEPRRWNSGTGAARAAQVRTVLENENLTASSAEELLGQPLTTAWHQAAIVWVSTDTPDAGPALQAGSRLLNDVSGRTPLTMLADDHTMWAWLSAPSGPSLDRALLRAGLAGQPTLRVALGAPGHGLGGFRSTLREAARAREVAETASDQDRQLVEFDGVAVAALLIDHPDDLRNWTIRVLGGLAGSDASTAALRQTVQVFLQVGGSFTEAAARLHLHRNTVHYRVRKAEEMRGRPFTDERLNVEVALIVCDLLWYRIELPVARS